ncbi:30S ribosomal protein S8e [Candidatus Woesearchaeota archaeon]|nr:30S ribosomal protein S8e [Candidatus Woesearchaeota archaeon]
MVIVQKRSNRKPSGARYKGAPTKRLRHKGNSPANPTIGEKRIVASRAKGGREKNRLLSIGVVNVVDAKGKHVQAKIERVAENAANRHFVRRNILTRGAVVVTDKGKVRVTNRPGQEGSLQGVFVE